MAKVRVLIQAEERVKYSTTVVMEAEEFARLNKALDASHDTAERAASEIQDCWIDVQHDWQDATDFEVTEFSVAP